MVRDPFWAPSDIPVYIRRHQRTIRYLGHGGPGGIDFSSAIPAGGLSTWVAMMAGVYALNATAGS